MHTNPHIIFQLPSGLRCVFSQVDSPVAYCALGVAAGSRMEPPKMNGLAHLTEHMLFKGTQKRSTYYINTRLERLGGELNAYTTKEELVVHATTLKDDLPKALDLLSDLFFHASFPAQELLKEKEVVADEIALYKDTPPELIADEFDKELFGSHPLAAPILGSRQSLANIQSSHLFDFAQRHFVPSQMILSVVAQISERRMRSLAQHYFNLQSSTFIHPPGYQGAMPEPFFVEKKRHTRQAYCVLGGRAYNYADARRVPLALLVNLLGGAASNSRLNLLLREKHGIVYNVDASYTPYSDLGMTEISFGSDKNNWKQCLALIHGELDRLFQSPMTEKQLQDAQKQLIGQLAIAADNAEAKCLNQLKSVMVFGKIEPPEQLEARIRAVSAEMLMEIARDIFNSKSLSTMVYV